MCMCLTLTASTHMQSKKLLGFEKSHCCTDVRSVRSPAGSSLAEVDIVWQPSHGMTGLFPWEHICRLCGVRPKCWRGITNKDYTTGGKINHTNDDSKRELWQNAKIPSPPLVSPRFPWNWHLTGRSRDFLAGLCRHDIPDNLMWMLELKKKRSQEREYHHCWELSGYFGATLAIN